MATVYCLRFETPPTWRARPLYIPQEQGGPVLPPGNGFPFRRLLRLAGLLWRYSNPPPQGIAGLRTTSPRYIAPARTAQKTLVHYCVFSRWRGKKVSTELFPSNSCCTVACLHSRYLAVDLHVTILSYVLRVMFPSHFFPSGFPAETLYALLNETTVVTSHATNVCECTYLGARVTHADETM
jgi:hypothetical protein